MYTLGRILQGIGLAIPVLAIISQLQNGITAGQMLQFLVASVCVFSIGYVLQRYSGGGKT
jgi:hypothetical protein